MPKGCKSSSGRSLIIIAHGSRREAANAEFRAVVHRVREAVCDIYARVEPAFLDSAFPTLAEAATALMNAGAINIDVYPFFLTTGKHADEDIPRMVADLNAQRPDCTLTMLDYLGKSEALVGVIVQHIHAQNGSG